VAAKSQLKFDRKQVQIALAELARERHIREKYYPKAISERKLSAAEAKRRLEALDYAIQILSSLLEQEHSETSEVSLL